MSAIGDYIHLHAWNYIDYGINKINEKPSIDGMAALKSERDIIRKKVATIDTFKQTQALERDLNNLIDYLGSDKEDNEVNPSDIRNIMEQIITDLSILAEPTEPLKFLTDTGVDKKEGDEIIAKIKGVMEENKTILALTAPQIGIKSKIFCIRFNDIIKR